MKKILLLEDNVTTLNHIKSLIQEIDIKTEVFAFENMEEAYRCVLDETIDLFLIDIILNTSIPGDSSGVQFAEHVRQIENYKFVPMIFITSLEDAKMHTYENLHCYSFIEKPFDPVRVKSLISECLGFPGKKKEKKTLYFRKDGIVLAVERDDIVYVESIKHILHIHLIQGDIVHIPYVTLKKMLEKVSSSDFVQCSRSIIVNKQFISNADIPNGVILLKNDFGSLETGVVYKKYLREIFK